MLAFTSVIPLRPSCVTSARPRACALRPCMQAGFGASSPKPARSSRKPAKKPATKQRTVRATYLELVGRGCTEFVAFARISGSGAAGWERVGLLIAESDDKIGVAVGASKRAILEHAKQLWPLLCTVRELEVGYGREDEDVEKVQACVWVDGDVTSAFSPDRVQTPFYVVRTNDGRAAPVDTSSKLNKNRNSAFAPRGKGEGKTPEAGS